MRAGPAGRSVGTMAGSSGSGSSFVGSLLVRMKGYNILYVIFCVKYFIFNTAKHLRSVKVVKVND